ncbi:MAG: hypothetical protein JXR52_10020 [Bacteroidales bacterium]|nr:hypothetical protein [Bacteroidales bacterium]MBN2699153.1 hypothetical protein [Bacteroidales bacterium]
MKFLPEAIWLSLILFAFSVEVSGRSPSDSVLKFNDSIQDLRIERITRDMGTLDKKWNTQFSDHEQLLDSFNRVIFKLRKNVNVLEKENKVLSDEIISVKEQFEKQVNENASFRSRLATLFWISGPIILLLLLALFLLLFLHNRKTKNYLRNEIEGISISSHNEINRVREELGEEVQTKFDSLRAHLFKEIKTTVKSRLKKLKRRKK